MSTVNASDPTAKSASKKKRKSKKKPNGKSKDGAEPAEANGVKGEQDEDDGDDEEPETPIKSSLPSHVRDEDTLHMPSSPPEPASPVDESEEHELPVRNGTAKPMKQNNEPETMEPVEEDQRVEEAEMPEKASVASDTTARLEAMQQERDSLRFEVTQLRKSLEQIQERHESELSTVREELNESKSGKDHAETQYKTLLGRVNTIRSQLGERLKADAEELSKTRAQIEELEASNKTLQDENQSLQDSTSKLSSQLEGQASEIDTLRSRTNLSTSNWAKERDDLTNREAYAREEFEAAKQAMQDWEVLAMEERSLRENLSEKVSELEDQLSTQREAYSRARNEADGQSQTVDGLQRALQDIQDARKRELRELVENSQAQLEELRRQAQAAQETVAQTASELKVAQKELERALPFEREVKEKNLLIGKLRHEAVILNDHLTKALRFLKRGKPEDNVDRQIVTNHFLHFLALDRSDPKKFQVLQLIAALLGWDDEQRERAGLSRPGLSNNALKVPLSPFRRTPSTPALSTDFMPESPAGASKESLAELWSDFLAREAEAGGGGSRRGSVAHSQRSASASGPFSPDAEKHRGVSGGYGLGIAGRQSPEVGRKEGTG